MTTQAKARLLAAVIFCVLISFGGYMIERGHLTEGREAFLAGQARRFDHFDGTLDGHFFAVGALLGVAILGGYELLAYGLYLAIRPKQGRSVV